MNGERDDEGHDEGLVGHGVYDGADDGLLAPAPREEAVEDVGDAGVEEEGEGGGGEVVQDEVAGGRGGDEAC